MSSIRNTVGRATHSSSSDRAQFVFTLGENEYRLSTLPSLYGFVVSRSSLMTISELIVGLS